MPSFESIGILVQKKKSKTNFQDVGHGSHLGFPILTILAIVDLKVISIFPIKLRVNWPFRSEEVQNSGLGGHFGFLIGMILAIVDLQVIPILTCTTKFRVNWPCGSVVEVQNRFFKMAAILNY